MLIFSLHNRGAARPHQGNSRGMGDGHERFTYTRGRNIEDVHPNSADNRRSRSPSHSPARGRKFRFVETAQEEHAANRQVPRREQDTQGDDMYMQVRKSPRINAPRTVTPATSENEESPNGPTHRYQQVGDETPTGRSKWTDEKEALLCTMWEDEEHLYNAALDDHRRNDRRREAIRRIAARLGLEG